MTLTNGKLMFLWWAGMGSDFNLPQKLVASAPFRSAYLNDQQRQDLLDSLPELEQAMAANLSFKLNAQKKSRQLQRGEMPPCYGQD